MLYYLMYVSSCWKIVRTCTKVSLTGWKSDRNIYVGAIKICCASRAGRHFEETGATFYRPFVYGPVPEKIVSTLWKKEEVETTELFSYYTHYDGASARSDI